MTQKSYNRNYKFLLKQLLNQHKLNGREIVTEHGLKGCAGAQYQLVNVM